MSKKNSNPVTTIIVGAVFAILSFIGFIISSALGEGGFSGGAFFLMIFGIIVLFFGIGSYKNQAAKNKKDNANDIYGYDKDEASDGGATFKGGYKPSSDLKKPPVQQAGNTSSFDEMAKRRAEAEKREKAYKLKQEISQYWNNPQENPTDTEQERPVQGNSDIAESKGFDMADYKDGTLEPDGDSQNPPVDKDNPYALYISNLYSKSGYGTAPDEKTDFANQSADYDADEVAEEEGIEDTEDEIAYDGEEEASDDYAMDNDEEEETEEYVNDYSNGSDSVTYNEGDEAAGNAQVGGSTQEEEYENERQRILGGINSMETGKIERVVPLSGGYCAVTFTVQTFTGTIESVAAVKDDGRFTLGSSHYIMVDNNDKRKCTVL